MKPDASYIKLQTKLRTWIKQGKPLRERIKLERELEKRFVAAWGFTSDRHRLARSIGRLIWINFIPGFDHCDFYAGANGERVIISQTYVEFPPQLRASLTLENGLAPEIIVATEWAFYNPGNADLRILKFPCSYEKALEESKLRNSRLSEIQGETELKRNEHY